MEIIYAALLLHKAKKPITEDSIKHVLEAASIHVDSAKIKALIAALDGVDIEKAIKEAAVVTTSASVSHEPVAEKKAEKKEEEKKDEAQVAAGLGALFG